MNVSFSVHAFDDLTPRALHDVLRLRSEIFQIEQQCLYLDLDGYDPLAHHLLGYMDGALVAAARLFAPHLDYKGEAVAQARIGRVITAPFARGQGLGHVLMARAIAECRARYGATAGIAISAQSHLQGFYGQHGFVPCGNDYLEDDIPHINMLLP